MAPERTVTGTGRCATWAETWLYQLAPDRLRHTPDQLQLPALVVGRDPVPFHGRREAALRAQRQALEGDEPRCLLDAPLHLVVCFQLRFLPRDQAYNRDPVLGPMSQRL